MSRLNSAESIGASLGISEGRNGCPLAVVLPRLLAGRLLMSGHSGTFVLLLMLHVPRDLLGTFEESVVVLVWLREKMFQGEIIFTVWGQGVYFWTCSETGQ